MSDEQQTPIPSDYYMTAEELDALMQMVWAMNVTGRLGAFDPASVAAARVALSLKEHGFVTFKLVR